MATPVAALLALFDQRDRAGALKLAHDLLDEGWTYTQLITDLLAPAQQQVGRRWEVAEWNVAQEHAATAITDSVLSALALELPADTRRPFEVVVACAEDDWHVLPVRMFAELLTLDGWPITFVGASTPHEHLRPFLVQRRPFAVAIGCSVPIFLPGVQRMVDAAAAEGVPALVGGAGCGPDARRAAALGAHWAPDASSASHLLDSWARDGVPDRPQPAEHPVAAKLAAVRSELVERAFDLLAERHPLMGQLNERQLQRTAEDLGYILQFLEAAVLTDDRRIIDDFVPWLQTVLTSRGLPDDVAPMTLRAVADCIPADLAPAPEWISAAAEIQQHAP
jgi:methanogenic corrinoid protein MtbC1